LVRDTDDRPPARLILNAATKNEGLLLEFTISQPDTREAAAASSPSPALEARIPPELLKRWRTLWAAQERPTPNAEPGRFLAVCEALGAEPALLEVDGGRGLIVARRERTRVTRRIGYLPVRTPELDTLTVVYGGILGDASSEAVAARLDEAMRGRDGVEHVMVNKLHVDDPLYGLLAQRPRSVALPSEPHWVIDLGDEGYDELIIREHSSKHRKNLRRLDRRLFETYPSAELREYRDINDVDAFARASDAVARKSYQHAIGAGPPPASIWRAILRSAALRDHLMSFALLDDGQMIVYQAGVLYGKTYYCEGTSYRPEYAASRPGTVLLHRVLKDLCGHAVRTVDFGFGDAEYKRIYGTRSWMESTIHLYGRRLRAGRAYLMDAASMCADGLCKRALGGAMAQKIKRAWRGVISGE